MLTNFINSKVAKVIFHLALLHSHRGDPEIMNHLFYFFSSNIKQPPWGNEMDWAPLETLGIKIQVCFFPPGNSEP